MPEIVQLRPTPLVTDIPAQLRRMADIDENVNGEDYLARTVFEDHELIDIGVLDRDGNKIMARKKPDPVGFVRWRAHDA